MEVDLLKAEAILGEDVVIGRAMTWRMTRQLCDDAGQYDPAECWAYAVWDEQKRNWIEPTVVFQRLSDLISHCQDRMKPHTDPAELS